MHDDRLRGGHNVILDRNVSSASAPEEAVKWLSAFATSVSSQEPASASSLFHEHGFWKDILTLTWNFRTIRGLSAIRRLLDTRLSVTGLTGFRLLEDTVRGPIIMKPLPGLVFVRFCFEFETAHGKGAAVAFLVPTTDDLWKAWSLLTRLESLKEFPEQVGILHRRQREIDFESEDPAVVVIGAGHSGLETAARLKYLGVSTLVIDRNLRIGDNWRMRYKTLLSPLCSFPKTWPVYCPASKLGDWLESYATALDLNVWLSSSITRTDFIEETRTWRMPHIPGREVYHGTVLHSTELTTTAEFAGKKVVIVGACNSARYNEHFPVEFADLLGVALPFATQKHLLRASVERTANTTDKDLIEGLERAGFRTYLGPDGAGLLPLVFERGGGFYIDTGASREIINGAIRVKSSCSVRRFTQGGLELEDGTTAEGDAVIFATGFGDIRDAIKGVCGPEVADKVGNIWGLDAEGELQGVWKRTGQPRLWIAMGESAHI
ncbi:hypothetical protein BU15DRAFT_88492 [Melanogaster broomeanus]|nr:hypothetical protein BU15DRAFT_88492 [Melanogaster broomeanus]